MDDQQAHRSGIATASLRWAKQKRSLRRPPRSWLVQLDSLVRDRGRACSWLNGRLRVAVPSSIGGRPAPCAAL